MSGDSEMKNADVENVDLIDVDQYRKLVRQFVDMRRYQTALFWAEKVCILSKNDPKDVYNLAHCMFLLQEYHRAAHLIRFFGLEKTHVPSYNLLLESLYEGKELTEAVSAINNVDIEFLASSLINQPLDGDSNSRLSSTCEESGRNELLASICFLKGKIYEAMDNRGLAMDFYVQALQKSVYCFEALEALVQHEMLTAWEEKELLQHLPINAQASEADAKFILKLYESKMKKYYDTQSPPGDEEFAPICGLKSVKEIKEKILKNRSNESQLHKNIIPKITTPNQTATQILSPANKLLQDLKCSPMLLLQNSLNRGTGLPQDSQSTPAAETTTQRHQNKESTTSGFTMPLATCIEMIQSSVDFMAAEAERLFYISQYKKSIKLLDQLLKIDPYHNGALTTLIGCLVELGDYNRLFYLAHKLVDRYPDKAISWYAVGCYYDLIGKSDPARRYLSKSTSLDRLYGPAWLAYGHSFAKENEHDQAMAAYFKATQLMRGCHLPLLYIGVECGLTKNLELAEKFFYQAMSIAPLDVFVLHELGVIKYEYEEYASAHDVFLATVDIITQRAKESREEISARWEPLFNNLGHCCRKIKKYDNAIEYHQQALLLKPQSPQTLTAIGFVYALMGNLEEAIKYFHKSLAINRDCTVTSTILKTCIEDMMDDHLMFKDIYGESILNLPATTMLAKIGRSSAAKEVPPIEEEHEALSTVKTKLKFEEDEFIGHAELGDINVSMDMSLDS